MNSFKDKMAVVNDAPYVILGGGGNTGSIIANSLLSKGEKVRVLGRDAGRLQRFVRKGGEASKEGSAKTEPGGKVTKKRSFVCEDWQITSKSKTRGCTKRTPSTMQLSTTERCGWSWTTARFCI
jgi:hypothetical protein